MRRISAAMSAIGEDAVSLQRVAADIDIAWRGCTLTIPGNPSRRRIASTAGSSGLSIGAAAARRSSAARLAAELRVRAPRQVAQRPQRIEHRADAPRTGQRAREDPRVVPRAELVLLDGSQVRKGTWLLAVRVLDDDLWGRSRAANSQA
jgi:hypothetical protein